MRTEMNRVQALAAMYALLPMAVGLSVLGLFVLTDAAALPLFGVVVLWFGVVATVTAAVCAIRGHARARCDGVERAQRWRVSACLAALIVANYPLAAVCASAGIAWETRYTLQLVNGADTPWLVELRGPGVDEQLTVPAGASPLRRMWFRGDGALTLRADGREAVVEGYVTHNLGGEASVVRGRDGAIRVFSRDD